MKSTHAAKEAYVFLGLTLALSYFVFWGPLALFKVPAISFVSDVRGPAWGIALFLIGPFVPSLLAIYLTWRKEGKHGLRSLGRSILQFKLGWRWYAVTFLIVITGTVGQVLIYQFIGNPFDARVFVAQLGSFLPLLILGPLSEELGWRGYALDRLQTRWNALISSLIVGLVWSLWHLPLFQIPGTSQHEMGVPFIGFLIKVTSSSVLYTWLYNNTRRSLWSAILLHWLYTYAAQVMSSEVVRSPLYNGLEYLPYVIMAAAVVLIWKPQTLRKLLVATALILLLALAACTAPQVQTPKPAATSTSTMNMPNPASVYCAQLGNKLEIHTAADGSQSGVCVFPDGSTCDEWAYFRGECGSAAQDSPTPAITVEASKEAGGSRPGGNASGGYMPPGNSEALSDWWGLIKRTPTGAQYDDYFERQDLGQVIYFGIDSMDPAVKSQIEALRDSGKIVHLYGTLVSNVPDYNGSQIQVDRIEVE